MFQILLLFLLHGVCSCPRDCTCNTYSIGSFVVCSGPRLTGIPSGLPPNTVDLTIREAANIRSFSDTNFDEIVELSRFSIIKSALTDLRYVTFSRLTNIKEINVIFGNIRYIEQGVFNTSQITTIDFSNNRISDISFLGNLYNLQKLNLNSNSIRLNNGYKFSSLERLESFHIEDNAISTLHLKSLDGLEGLKSLYIGYNDINITSLYGALKSSNLLKITQIALEYASISGFPYQICSLGFHLKRIILTGNDIVSLDSRLSENCSTHMEDLVLENTGLLEIDDDTFCNCTKLKYLNLMKNRLASFPKCLGQLPKLSSIILSENNIKTIDMGYFPVNFDEYFYNLDISNNKISLLQGTVNINETALNMNSLQKLVVNLTHNSIGVFPDSVFPLRNILDWRILSVDIYLEDNNIMCDCSVMYMLEYPTNYKFFGTCKLPTNLKGEKLGELTKSDLPNSCSESSSIPSTAKSTTFKDEIVSTITSYETTAVSASNVHISTTKIYESTSKRTTTSAIGMNISSKWIDSSIKTNVIEFTTSLNMVKDYDVEETESLPDTFMWWPYVIGFVVGIILCLTVICAACAVKASRKRKRRPPPQDIVDHLERKSLDNEYVEPVVIRRRQESIPIRYRPPEEEGYNGTYVDMSGRFSAGSEYENLQRSLTETADFMVSDKDISSGDTQTDEPPEPPPLRPTVHFAD